MKEQQPGALPDSPQEKLPGFAQQEVLRFMRAAIEDRAHLQGPERASRANWARDLNITGTYLYTQANLREIGKRYELTGEGVRRVVKTTLTCLWERCSPLRRGQYSLSALIVGKPTTQRERERLSMDRGGKSVRVMQALKEGRTFEQIKEEFGLTSDQLSGARAVLRRWGSELPLHRRSRTENRELEDGLRSSRGDKEIQRLLDRVNRGFLNRDRQSDNPCLMAVVVVARDAGFHFRPQVATSFVNSIREAGIPIVPVGYDVKSGSQKGHHRDFFIAAQHTARAQTVFLENPKLQKFLENPVEQICGPKMDVPSTTRLMRSGDFERPGRILIELGVNRKKLRDFLTEDCPIPVFRHRHSHYYPTDCQDKLRAFFRRRLKELSEQ